MLTFIPITYTPCTQKHTVLPALRVNSAQSKRHAKLDTTETKTEQRHMNNSPAPGKLQKKNGFNKDKIEPGDKTGG